jgi:hypothetical protein
LPLMAISFPPPVGRIHTSMMSSPTVMYPVIAYRHLRHIISLPITMRLAISSSLWGIQSPYPVLIDSRVRAALSFVGSPESGVGVHARPAHPFPPAQLILSDDAAAHGAHFFHPIGGDEFAVYSKRFC